MFAAEESGRVKGLYRIRFGPDLQVLADIDKRRNVRIQRAQRARNDRAHVRRSHRLWRRIPGVPVELMTRMKDKTKIADAMRSDQRAAVHHLSDPFQALGELYAVNHRIDARKCAEHQVRFEPALVRRVALGVERLGLRHAACHPQQDHAVGARRNFGRRGDQPRLAAGKRTQGSRARSSQEVPPGKAGRDVPSNTLFFAVHSSFINKDTGNPDA